MSLPQSISDHVLLRFREAFGAPQNTLGRDHHWRFPALVGTHTIDVLVNGTRDTAAVWIFDGDPSVISTPITDRDGTDAIIKQLQGLIKS